MTRQKLKCDAQILLLLPSEWVDELDFLARVNCSTRLALIRRFLRAAIDERSSDLRLHWKTLQKNKRIRRQIEEHCDENDFGMPKHKKDNYF